MFDVVENVIAKIHFWRFVVKLSSLRESGNDATSKKLGFLRRCRLLAAWRPDLSVLSEGSKVRLGIFSQAKFELSQ